MYTTTEVKNLLGVASDNTIRKYCQEFAGHLSEDATPSKGATRRFSPRDVQVLRAAREMLASGKVYSEVNGLLGTVDFEQDSEPVEWAVGASDTPPTVVMPLAVDAQFLPLLQAVANNLDALRENAHRGGDIAHRQDEITQQVQNLESRVARAERSKVGLLVVVLAFTAGFALAVLLVYVMGIL